MAGLRAPRSLFLAAIFEHADVSGAQLEGAVFQQTDAAATRFDGADLSKTVWDGSRHADVSFAGADLRYSRFDHARGTRIDFDRAMLDSSRFHGAAWQDTTWRGASRRHIQGTNAALLAAEARTLSTQESMEES